MNNQPEVYEYPEKCPVCGLEEKLIASLAIKEIDRGVSPDAVYNHLHIWPFVLRKPNYPVIIGSKTSAGDVLIDICKGCGVVRAVRIEVGEAVVLERPGRG